MTEEEEKAIENIDKRLTIEKYTKNIATPVYLKDLETILNLIQKQQVKVETHIKANMIRTQKFNKELEKKDKIIELLTKFIENNISEKKLINEICIKGRCENEECHEDDIKDCIKQYFESKVEVQNEQ